MPPPLKCRRALSPHGRAGLFLLAAALWAPAARPGTILPPDAAARAYEAGREAVRRGNYALAVERLEEALATGHTRPQERLGTTRNFVVRYDPDYWLGVAYMEMGDRERARSHLSRSRGNGLVLGWPESSDLLARLARLEPTPVPSRAPEPAGEGRAPRETAAVATATPEPVPPRPVEASAAPIVAVPAGAAATPPVEGRALDSPRLRAVVAALAKGDLGAAEAALEALRAEGPQPPQVDLLTAVVYGTRYLLEGSRERALVERARRALATYRERGGSRSAERLWISPALAAALG